MRMPAPHEPPTVGDALDLWHKDVEQFQMVDPATMRELCRRAQAGDRDARNRAVEANLRLVESFAKQYVGHGLDLVDLIQHGNLGLMRAVEGYNTDGRYAFSTYASYWIRQRLQRAIDDTGRAIRVPTGVATQTRKARRGKPVGEEWTASIVAAERVADVLSMDAPLVELDREHPTFQDMLATQAPSPEKIVVERQSAEHFVALVRDILSPREMHILALHYGLLGEARTLEAIGRQLRLTRERVRQIEARAIHKLQDKLALDPNGDGVALKSVLRQLAAA